MITLSPDIARRRMVGHLGLAQTPFVGGAADLPALLEQLTCIQLDPLDPMGTNADLVAMARIAGLRKGEVYDLVDGHGFEHFAKERCILPAAAFPYYRDQAAATPWWRLRSRLERLDPAIIEAVLDEVRRCGPVTAAELTSHGGVKPLDWSGWKGTSKATSMAIEVLWTRCQVVVCGRTPAGKRYDIPERALPEVAGLPAGDFFRWALKQRVQAAGLLSRAGGPWWSMLQSVRTSGLVDELLETGELVEVVVSGSRRSYLTTSAFLEAPIIPADDRMRILAPLDPVIWDRKLTHHGFGFDYVWEVYKPSEKRRWGWYVQPLLHRGELVGRLEGRLGEAGGKRPRPVLTIANVWREDGHELDEKALSDCLEQHAAACGAREVRLTRRRR